MSFTDSSSDILKYQDAKLFPFPGLKRLEEQRNLARILSPSAADNKPSFTDLRNPRTDWEEFRSGKPHTTITTAGTFRVKQATMTDTNKDVSRKVHFDNFDSERTPKTKEANRHSPSSYSDFDGLVSKPSAPEHPSSATMVPLFSAEDYLAPPTWESSSATRMRKFRQMKQAARAAEVKASRSKADGRPSVLSSQNGERKRTWGASQNKPLPVVPTESSITPRPRTHRLAERAANFHVTDTAFNPLSVPEPKPLQRIQLPHQVKYPDYVTNDKIYAKVSKSSSC
jgi:hypothetical protein